MRYSNLHTHTVFSDGIHTVEENVRAAQSQQLLCLGFSDHSYTPCDRSYCMLPENYSAYRHAVEKAKKNSPLPIYLGLELDAFSRENPGEYDYVIASVHYLNAGGAVYAIDHTPQMQHACLRDGFHGNAWDMLRCYCDTLGEHVAKTNPTFIGHFDLPAKFSSLPEQDDRYVQILSDGLKALLKLCPYIELNTGGMAKGWRQVPYPAPAFLDVIREHGGRIILSSDSHRADTLTYWFDQAVELLKSHGIDRIHHFDGKGFAEAAI